MKTVLHETFLPSLWCSKYYYTPLFLWYYEHGWNFIIANLYLVDLNFDYTVGAVHVSAEYLQLVFSWDLKDTRICKYDLWVSKTISVRVIVRVALNWWNFCMLVIVCWPIFFLVKTGWMFWSSSVRLIIPTGGGLEIRVFWL